MNKVLYTPSIKKLKLTRFGHFPCRNFSFRSFMAFSALC